MNSYKQYKYPKYKLMLKLLDISEIKDSTYAIYWLTKSD